MFVSDNGYAYYSPLQLGDLMLVSALQRAGSSLADIGSYLRDPQGDQLESIIAEHVQRLEAERRALRAQQRFLQKTLDRSRAISEWRDAPEGWRMVDLAEERFFDVDISGLFAEGDAGPESERQQADELVGSGLLLLDQGLANQMQGSCRVGLQALLSGHPERDFHFCMAAAPPGRRGTRHVRPAGRYFQRLRCASIDDMLVAEGSLFAAYLELADELRERGLEPMGDLYEQELSLYTGDIAAECYTELSIRVG